jgi:hypothetical protein
MMAYGISQQYSIMDHGIMDHGRPMGAACLAHPSCQDAVDCSTTMYECELKRKINETQLAHQRAKSSGRSFFEVYVFKFEIPRPWPHSALLADTIISPTGTCAGSRFAFAHAPHNGK